jgi:hypothetical protein
VAGIVLLKQNASFDRWQTKCPRRFDMVGVAYGLDEDFFGFLSAPKKFEADIPRTRKSPGAKALAKALQREERGSSGLNTVSDAP